MDHFNNGPDDHLFVLFIEEEAAKKDAKYHMKTINAETTDILEELQREYKAPVCSYLFFPITVPKCFIFL